MIERARRNELLRKFVAAIALLACVGVGIAIVATTWTQLVGGGPPPAAPTPETPTNQPPPPPPENIRPLQVRPVLEILPPDQCPPEGQPPAAPGDEFIACDFARSAAYRLGPQAMEVQLTHVETRKSATSEFYVVRVTIERQSAARFSAYTAQHVGSQVAFIRDDIVVFAPKITQIINSAGLEISGNLTEQQAGDVARLIRKPA